MKKKLAEIFKDKCVTGIIPNEAEKYYWYLDEENEPIGISKEISQIERELIELNYVRLEGNKLEDIEKLLWRGFLTKRVPGQIPVNATVTTTIKFIFFFHDFDTHLQLEFESLVQGFNDEFKVFFWEPEYGVILDLSAANAGEDSEIEDFLLASKQVFSSALIFYQTRSYEINRQLPEKFQIELELFKEFKENNQSLMGYQDIFLGYLFRIEDIEEHPLFEGWFSPLFSIDVELLAIVKCYLENGFNITTSAKMMYMHRNTFMNKLDRFMDVTGLDMKKFDDAVIAYMLIRLRKDV